MRAMRAADGNDLERGSLVRAFHPRTLGVVHAGTVQKVGTVYVHVKFHVDGRTYKLLPQYVTAVLEIPPSWQSTGEIR